MEHEKRAERDEFRRKLKSQWALMWNERFDDKMKAEAVAVNDYPLLMLERGLVVFANRDAKAPVFSEIVTYWSSRGMIYSPNPHEGGWGKFIRTTFATSTNSKLDRRTSSRNMQENAPQQHRKGGRGWLHKQ